MISFVKSNIEKITEACRKHQIKSLYLFGSAATGNFNNGSDIDFLVDYKKDNEGLPIAPFDYFDFLFLLEEITGKKVDLVVSDAVRNKYFKEKVDKEKLLLYAE